ncbi:zinc-dependent alcohol dehydrogenase family protein [Synechococcus elongatus PCC 11802]|uniref:Zinc-dependent alcohol dehydrogenase family protein n=2 Tax=Synechococcus elongatus TaxID=32046 RepID=A0AAT9JVP7_SYNEL|nr:zinc-dependent alcohol dehydrogenase family protein [Synechococcus elongatus]QFZ91367.1 alcohol dehydrogenase [Synechococcus elongatus PCC 11802]
MMSDSMRAVVLETPGDPGQLRLQFLPQPAIVRPTQVLVRLQAAGLNPIDTKLRQRGTFDPDRRPAILGCDGAGWVAAVGSAVNRFAVGDAVYFCHGGLGLEPGTYADYAVVDQAWLAPKPEQLSFVEAAGVPLALITAWESLYDRGRLQAAQTVLIHAGAGGVGHLAIQLAKLRGARVATTVSTPKKAAIAQHCGADLVIPYLDRDWVAAVLDWTDGKGVDLAFDTVGGSVLEQTFPAVRLYGDLVTILAPDPATNWKVARDRNLRISLELMLTPQLQSVTEARHHQTQILETASRWFDQGQLQIHISQVLPITEIGTAHQLLESQQAAGKIVIDLAA